VTVSCPIWNSTTTVSSSAANSRLQAAGRGRSLAVALVAPFAPAEREPSADVRHGQLPEGSIGVACVAQALFQLKDLIN
jgi:hypothetical protein